MKTVLIVLIVLLVLAIVFFFASSLVMANMVMKPKTHSQEEIMSESIRLGRFTEDYLKTIEMEEFTIPSQYGYELHAIIQNNDISKLPENKNKVAILCHGYSSGKLSMSGYAKRLMKLGFTCLMYDHRGHGENTRNVLTSMGYYEKYDLKTVVDYCYERFGNDIRIVTAGESMGSAIVLNHLAIDNRIACVMADCGYSDASKLFTYLLKTTYKLPVWPTLPLASLIVKARAHFDVRDITPIKGVEATKTPILFCHGEADTFVPTFMSKEMYKAGTGPKELYLCPGAKHAVSEVTDSEKYTEVIEDFIKKYYDSTDVLPSMN